MRSFPDKRRQTDDSQPSGCTTVHVSWTTHRFFCLVSALSFPLESQSLAQTARKALLFPSLFSLASECHQNQESHRSPSSRVSYL
jgi:hypothetical protein